MDAKQQACAHSSLSLACYFPPFIKALCVPGRTVKNLSILSLMLAIVLVLLADFGFEQNRAESIVTRIIIGLNPLEAPESSPPSMKPTPFYQIEKNANYILNITSLIFVLITIWLEGRALKNRGRNKKSAGIIAISVAVCWFNLMLITWNT